MNTTNVNPQTRTNPNLSQSMQMTDKDIINDILAITKAECGLYMHGTIEASTPKVFETFKNILQETIAMQNEIFKTMQNKGWYQVEQVQKQKVEKCKQKLANS